MLSNAATDQASRAALPFIFNALYQLDATLAPVPDLAAEPCDTSADGLTWTCTVREARFHSRLPVTAEDVAYTYRLAQSPQCSFREALCLSTLLANVEAIGDRTIVFTLAEPFAPFAILYLPEIVIESKIEIERAFADVVEDLASLDPGALPDAHESVEALADGALDADCSEAAREVETLLLDFRSLWLPQLDDFRLGGEGLAEFDHCAYLFALEPALEALMLGGGDPDLDDVAAAYPFLASGFTPVGTGPWMCRPECMSPGESLTLSAFEGHFDGPPVTEMIDMRMYRLGFEAAGALLAGEVDWVPNLDRSSTPGMAVADAPGIRFAESAELGYYSLQYNLREGQLFADLGARKAIQHCVDKPALVELSTTLGTGIPIEGYVPPGSWAYDPDLPTVARDTDVGMEFLRDAGWTVEDEDRDGVADRLATRDGETFSTNVYVRAGRPDRFAFVSRLANEVAECGIELNIVDTGFIQSLRPLLTFPHIGTDADGEPWDAYFGGWSSGVDPDAFAIWHSSQCTSEEQPESFNYICFDNPRADRLIEGGRRESDLDERARIYRELQQVMYDQQPHLFAWSDITTDAFDRRLTSSSGDLQLDSPMWDWQLETLYLPE